MKTVWNHSLDTEAGRVICTAETAARGFFASKGFYVLPYESARKMSGPTAFMPEIDYLSIPRFWHKIRSARVDNRSPRDFAEALDLDSLRQEIKKQLIRKPYSSVKWQGLKSKWQWIEKEFFKELEHFVPGIQSKVGMILIMPTRFGTSCSFSVPKSFPSDISIYLREDQSIYALAEAICTAVTRHGITHDLRATWEESELLVDWMVTKTKIATLLGSVSPVSAYSPTLKTTRALSCAQMIVLSNDFCARLGLSSKNAEFIAVDDVIRYGDRTLRRISDKEKQVLRTMIEQKNKTVSHHEIARTIYQEKTAEKFSLWSVAKFMQRLRDKLEIEGISSHRIQTVYGKGFMLRV